MNKQKIIRFILIMILGFAIGICLMFIDIYIIEGKYVTVIGAIGIVSPIYALVVNIFLIGYDIFKKVNNE